MNDQLEQAIESVLTGCNVTAANEYILKFVDTDAAWTAAMLICKSRIDNDNIRYFAANILYTKVQQPAGLQLEITGLFFLYSKHLIL